MSSSDGRRLLVFGLSFAQQDSRKMQQVLGHYHKLPNTTNRAVLFTELNALAKELMGDEARQQDIQAITVWMQNGGPFPELAAQMLSTPSGPSDNPHATTRQPGNGHALNPFYHRRYGSGRTLDGRTEDEAAGDVQYHDMDEGHTGRLTRWHNRDIGHGFHGRDYTWQESDDDSPEDAGTIVVGGNTATANRRRDNSNQDITMTDGPHESDEDAMTNHIDAQEVFAAGPGPFDDKEIVECPICAEEYPRSNFPRRDTITDGCTHPEKSCLDCLEASIAAVIERGALHLLACPICPAKLTSQDVEEYASSEVHERYKYLKHQAEIPGHYISCMSPHCGGSQPHDSEDPRMICKYCDFASCARHMRPWHEGQTCSEFDLDDAQLERLEEEEATAKLLSKESTSICPKCGQGVTKLEGCDHMSCTCGEEWCYICSCSYENVIRLGNIAHATFCIYHPNKVNLTKSQQEAARNRIMGLVHGGEISAELTKARDELRERRRAAMRPKVAEAAEARRKAAKHQQKENSGTPVGNLPKKKKVKLVAPWEEGGWKKRSL